MRAVETESRSNRSRLLLVDDEPAILITAEAVLEETYAVETACRAEQAIALMAERGFEVVCADYAMGAGMNGIELLAKVAAMPVITGTVLVTGQPDFGDCVPRVYVLLKPYEPRRLLEVVERAVTQTIARRRIAVSLANARRCPAKYHSA